MSIFEQGGSFLLTGKLPEVTKFMTILTRLVIVEMLRLRLKVLDLGAYGLGKHMPVTNYSVKSINCSD